MRHVLPEAIHRSTGVAGSALTGMARSGLYSKCGGLFGTFLVDEAV